MICATLSWSCSDASPNVVRVDFGNSGGSGGTGGFQVDSVTGAGPWGSTVSLLGSNLNGVETISIGELEITASDVEVEAWQDDRIELRVPFPAEGNISVSGAGESLAVGSFTPTWQASTPHPLGLGASVPQSLILSSGEPVALLDTDPPQVLRYQAGAWLAESVLLTETNPLSLRLYEDIDGPALIGLTTTTPRMLIQYRAANAWAPENSLIEVAEVSHLAGGTSGATVWQLDTDGWRRLRTTSTGLVEDAGPVADVSPTSADRQVVATSDGTLHVLWSENTGSTFDDVETGFMRRTNGSVTAFSSREPATRGVDDFFTSFVATPRGRGFSIDYCGSDLDPFGLTGTEYECWGAAHPSLQAGATVAPREGELTRHGFTTQLGITALCGGPDGTLVEAGEVQDIAIWPCASLMALEVGPQAEAHILVNHEGALYWVTPRVE